MITLHNVCAVQWGMFGTPGRYHDKCGGRSLGKQLNLYGNPSILNTPHCTHDIPHTHHVIPSLYSRYPPTVLNTPWCTHDILQCTEHPPPPRSTQLYPPSVLNISQCTAQTLCRVMMHFSTSGENFRKKDSIRL